MNERAGFGVRLGAALIDGLIVLIGVGILRLIFGGSWLGNVLQALAVLAYYSQEVFQAATPGKKALKLAIGGLGGLPAPSDALVKRYLVKISPTLISLVVAVLPFLGFLNFLGGLVGLVLFVGCFLVLGSKRQALHDMLADTAVYPAAGSFDRQKSPSDFSGSGTAAEGVAPPSSREPAPATPVAPPPPPPA